VAIYKLRASVINVNYRYTAKEIEYVLENADVVALVHERMYSDRVAAALPGAPTVKHLVVIEDGSDLPFTGVSYEDALASGSPERDFEERSGDDQYILYTGGTTGMPKGVIWRHEDVWRTLGGGINFLSGEPLESEYAQAEAGANGGMVRLCLAPLIHGNAQWAALMGLFGGDTIVLLTQFDAVEVWKAVERHKVNVIVLIGDAMARPMIEAFHAGSYDVSSVLAVSSSAALFSQSVKDQYLEAIPNAVITDSIGSSETGFGGTSIVAKGEHHNGGPRVTIDHRTVVLDEDGNEVKPGSGVRGVIAKKGNIPVGYYKDEKKTAETFRTYNGVRYAIPGDYAEVEADGTVTMLGRGSVSINSGGEKIYPEEVEAALKGHPDVFDALVVGVPDPRFGQHVAAVIQPREGARPTLADLDGFVRSEIAGYKVPRSLWYVDEVKRSPAGKPDYRWAKDQTEERPADDVHASHVGTAP